MAGPTSQDPLTPPTPSTPEQTISVTPKLRLCLRRKDNHFVPLVAVDELPSWIKLKGVPMSLIGADVLNLHMTNCGDYPRTNDDYYEVELNGILAKLQPCNVFEGNEAGESSNSQNSPTTNGKVFMAPDKNGEEWKTDSHSMGKEKAHIKGCQAKVPDLKMYPRVPVIKQGTSGTIGRKIYCSYWLRTGNCNFEQQGCKFRHEIPSDEGTRNMIGFRDCPDWWSVPPTQPKPANAFQVDRVHQATWRRGMTQDDQRELPASITRGHHRASSNIAAPVPHSDLVQRPSSIQAPVMMPTNTNGRASGARAPNPHKLQAAQQAALFLPQQQYLPSPAASMTQNHGQMQLNTFDGASGNTSIQPMTPTRQKISQSVPSTNELFSNAKVVSTIERRPEPATQPPISRPVFQDLGTYLKEKDTTKPIRYTPNQTTTETTSQASTPTNSDTTTSTHTMKANGRAFSINGSVPSTSQVSTTGNSGPKNAASDTGATASLSSLMDGSVASPPVMHHRLFVRPGSPEYKPNPIAPGSSKPRQRSRGKGRNCGAGKAGQSGRAPKAQVQAAQEENLLSL